MEPRFVYLAEFAAFNSLLICIYILLSATLESHNLLLLLLFPWHISCSFYWPPIRAFHFFILPSQLLHGNSPPFTQHSSKWYQNPISPYRPPTETHIHTHTNRGNTFKQIDTPGDIFLSNDNPHFRYHAKFAQWNVPLPGGVNWMGGWLLKLCLSTVAKGPKSAARKNSLKAIDQKVKKEEKAKDGDVPLHLMRLISRLVLLFINIYCFLVYIRPTAASSPWGRRRQSNKRKNNECCLISLWKV